MLNYPPLVSFFGIHDALNEYLRVQIFLYRQTNHMRYTHAHLVQMVACLDVFHVLIENLLAEEYSHLQAYIGSQMLLLHLLVDS